MIATDAKPLIEFLNVVSAGVAAAVVVAYLPNFVMALQAPQPTKGDVIIVGIVLTQAGAFLSRMVSLAYRSAGLTSVLNTDAVSSFIYIGIVGALLHLNAPEVINGDVPRKQWLRIGIVIGAGIFAAALLMQVRIWYLS